MRWAIFMTALGFAGNAEAACPGKFSHLARLVGEQPSVLLRNPEISSRMRELAGPRLRGLKQSLTVAPPVAIISCELVIEGNAPHQGGGRNAMLSFNLYSGTMTIAMLDRGRVIVRMSNYRYRDPRNYSHLPAHVRDWIYVASDQFRSRVHPPGNVVIEADKKDGVAK